jgi:hypothetical protein
MTGGKKLFTVTATLLEVSLQDTPLKVLVTTTRYCIEAFSPAGGR